MSKFPNKNSSTEKRAKNVNEAVLAALEELGATTDEVNVEVVDEGKKGLFGIGSRDAVVRVTLKDSVMESREKPQRLRCLRRSEPLKTVHHRKHKLQKRKLPRRSSSRQKK